jgi:hypothetical protein
MKFVIELHVCVALRIKNIVNSKRFNTIYFIILLQNFNILKMIFPPMADLRGRKLGVATAGATHTAKTVGQIDLPFLQCIRAFLM